jgi:TolB-like protein
VIVDAHSVAVLPFVAAGAATGDEPVLPGSRALAAGLQRELIAELDAVPGLYVVNAASVQPYAGSDLAPAEIGAQLGARGVLRGTASLVGGRVYLGAQLVDAATGQVLWAASYEQPIDELRAIQQDVLLQVVAALAVRPSAMSVSTARPDTSNALASVPIQSGAFE